MNIVDRVLDMVRGDDSVACMSVADEIDERYVVAVHEAGHAVAATVTGWRFRYVTLAPRSDAAGHVVPRGVPGSKPQWEPDLIVTAAGMLAEHLLAGEDPSMVAADNGGLGNDLRLFRDGCRWAYQRARDERWTLSPAIDPAWSVRDIAEHAWRESAALVVRYRAAVYAVANALYVHSTLRDAQVRAFVASEPLHDRPRSVEFWPAQYSRLVWRPAGRAYAEAVAE